MGAGSRSISDRIAALSPAKRALLEQQLLDRQADSAGALAIRPRSGSGPWPLSFPQQRLWFLQQLDPNDNSFALHRVIRLRGPLNIEALRYAQDSLVARHEALRTTIEVQDGKPVQVVGVPRSLEMPVLDVRGVEPAEREAQAMQAIEVRIEQPFDLTRDLMFRAFLVRLADDEYLWLMEEHHIAFDRQSSGIRERELIHFYEAYVAGAAAALPPLPIQYADYALWQRSQLSGPVLEKHLAYWRTALANAPAAIDLPFDRPRPALMSPDGGLVRTAIPAELAARLREFCRLNQLTPFMGLLTAFALLLHRYSSQADLVVGAPVSGRNRVELENIVGFFINTLALRFDFSSNPSFRDAAQRVRSVVIDGLAHQELPFERLVEELRPERSPSLAPLFQVTFQFKPPAVGRLTFSSITATDMPRGRGRTQFDLSLDMHETPAAFPCMWEYRTALFDRATVERMAANFETFLSDAVARPDVPIHTLNLMSEPERNGQLVACNQTRREFPAGECVHLAFEAQAAKTPDAVAVGGATRTLTYADLNAQANRLARRLQELGVGPESRVGLCIERSPEMIAGMLGILKAGAAIVPLDPAYPADRLASMQSDAGLTVLATTTALRGLVAAATPSVLCIDSDAALAGLSADNLHVLLHGDNTAYVIYTSGTSGRPKGVLSTHRGLLNHNRAAGELFGLTAADRVMQFSSMSFDTAFEEIFPALLGGAAVLLRPDSPVLGLSEFERWLAEQQPTLLNFPTAYWHTWVESFVAGGACPLPGSVRLVVIGGEAAQAALWRRWHTVVGPRVRLLNAYGPTEATISATWFDSALAADYAWPFVPIGRPLANVRAYVLDAFLEPRPVGSAGELYIGGEGLARGYYRRPDLTAERFVPDPFGAEAGARLYRTGDRVRRRVDGSIEYLGRVDRQVKLRGFRIELGEIEAALRLHPNVRDAAILMHRSATGSQLTAYVVAHETLPDSAALRGFLKTSLPEFMLPAAYIALDALPRTPSGKLDYAALEARPVNEAPPPQHVRMPRTLLERQLLQLWESALGVAPIGVSDNFFELGGHSLLAVQLFAQIEKAFGRSLPVSLIFDAPSVEILAKLLSLEGWEPVWSRLVGVQPHGALPPLFCITPFGHGIEFYSLANQLGSDQPLYALVANRDGDPTRFKQVTDEAEAYLAEIQRQQPDGPYYLLGYSSGAAPAMEIAQLLRARRKEVGMLAILDFDFRRGRQARPDEAWSRRAIAFARLGPRRQFVRVAGRLRSLLPRPAPPSSGHLASRPITQVAGMNRVVPSTVPGELQPRIRYEPRAYDGRVTLFCTVEQSRERVQKLQEAWRRLALGGLDVYEVPGDHLKLMQEPNVQVLAAGIARALALARQAERPS